MIKPTTIVKKPQRTMKILRAHIRGFAPDTLVARWATCWFQSLEGGDSISPSKPPPSVAPTSGNVAGRFSKKRHRAGIVQLTRDLGLKYAPTPAARAV
jgi:hypothetical protein